MKQIFTILLYIVIFQNLLEASRYHRLSEYQTSTVTSASLPKVLHKTSLSKVTSSQYNLVQTQHFNIYYGYDIPGTVAWNDNDGNGEYDYIDTLKQALELSWQKLVVDLGTTAPTKEKIDVYIANTGLYYNYALLKMDSYSLGYAKHNEFFLNGTINGNTYLFGNTIEKTDPLDLLKVTIAHEFFHIVQLPYRKDLSDANLFFYEGSAVWAESFVYPNIDDYIKLYAQDLPYALKNGLPNSAGFYPYAAGFFFRFLTQSYGHSIIKQSLENFALYSDKNALYALDEALKSKQSSLLQAFYDYINYLKTTTDSEVVQLKSYLEAANSELFKQFSLECKEEKSIQTNSFAYYEFTKNCDSYSLSTQTADILLNQTRYSGYGLNLTTDDTFFVFEYEGYENEQTYNQNTVKIDAKESFTITLEQNWNLVAMPYEIEPSELNSEHIEYIWGYEDAQWKLYIPSTSSFNGLQKGYELLQTIKPSQAVWIKTDKAATIQLPPKSAVCTTKHLMPSWNLWGNSCVKTTDIQNLAALYETIWTFFQGQWYLLDKNNTTDMFDTINSFESLKGYWIYNP